MGKGDQINEVMSFRLVHLLKALIKISDTVLGMVMAAKPVHPSNAEPPMVCRPSDRLTHDRFVQSSKAELPMVLTVLEKLTEEMHLHW